MKSYIDESIPIIENFIRSYFKRLSIIITQVPYDFRRLLLPAYMLYNGFKSFIYIDSSGRLGFEIIREKASRFSVKTKRLEGRIEQEIFGILGHENLFNIMGGGAEFINLIFTCKDFVEKYEHELPKGAILNFSRTGIIGPIEIGENAEVKIINCSIYWMIGNRRYVKHIPFAWLFGNIGYINRINPFLHAESDFYSSLFGALYEIITSGYEKFFDKDLRIRVLDFYKNLLEKVEEEFRKELSQTQADEAVFQQLLTRYKFFLYPGALLIESQPHLYGKTLKRRLDFHIQISGKEHIYVEIEPPFYKPFEGLKPSRRLKEALNQVEEWKTILNQPAIKENRYMIIIGRLIDLNKDEKEMLYAFNKKHKDMVLVTWDIFLENIDKLKREIDRIKSGNK
jgi:hypothetical protein